MRNTKKNMSQGKSKNQNAKKRRYERKVLIRRKELSVNEYTDETILINFEISLLILLSTLTFNC